MRTTPFAPLVLALGAAPAAACMLAALGAGALGWFSPVALPATPTVAPAAQGAAGAPYDLGSLHGAHGFSYSGTRVGVGAVASSGRIEFDGAGGLSASFTTAVNGNVFNGRFTGTYQVRGDGTGSILVNLPWLATQAHGSFVILDGGAGTYFTSTDAGYSVTGTTRQM